eukprot:10302901-Alexandrium_andersonii.AAC.1
MASSRRQGHSQSCSALPNAKRARLREGRPAPDVQQQPYQFVAVSSSFVRFRAVSWSSPPGGATAFPPRPPKRRVRH